MARHGPTEATAMNYAGIDYHKRYSVVCIADEGGRFIEEGWAFGSDLGKYLSASMMR